MMWDEVMERVRTLVIDDVTLSSIFAGAYRRAGVSDFTVPVLEWTLLSDAENELWAPMLVQFDCWTETAADARRAERRLRSLFHRPTTIVLDGVPLFTEYVDGADLATPSRANFTGRGVRFRFTPLRRQYALRGS